MHENMTFKYLWTFLDEYFMLILNNTLLFHNVSVKYKMAILHSQVCPPYKEKEFFILYKADYKHWLLQRNNILRMSFFKAT